MGMDRMFRVLAFWLLAIALMFLAGRMIELFVLFLLQAIAFAILSYFRLTERGYMYILGGYMVIAFCVIVFFSFFIGVGGLSGGQ